MRTIRNLAFVTAGLSYLLIVLGGVVRVTGSGLGCGDDWPLCNGRIIPPLDDMATLIEWGHRLVALGVSLLVVALAGIAFLRRDEAGVAGPGGPLRPAQLAVLLIVVQVMLGAITVWLELPPSAVVLHLSVAMGLVAVLVIAGLRAAGRQPAGGDARIWRSALAALGLGGLAVLLGGLTANLGAAGACIGFPLCSGELWPGESNGGLAHIHWTHRLVAYALTLHLVGVVTALVRRRAPAGVRWAAIAALGITLLQVVVAAAMMWSILQPHWRAAHVAAGSAVWVALVVLAWLAKPSHGFTQQGAD